MKKGNIKITRELFIETINEIKKQYDHDHKCSEAFGVILPNDFVSCYDNHLVCDQLIKLLKIAMKDDTKDSWIDYYIYELNFGSLYHDGTATTADGSFINLSTAGDLWNFLIKI